MFKQHFGRVASIQLHFSFIVHNREYPKNMTETLVSAQKKIDKAIICKLGLSCLLRNMPQGLKTENTDQIPGNAKACSKDSFCSLLTH